MSSITEVVSQQTVDLKGEHGLALLITRCKVAVNATAAVITVPALANTGTGAIPGSKGTTRTTVVSAGVLFDHGEPQGEVEGQVSGTSTAATVTAAANGRDQDVTVTFTSISRGDTFTLVTLHRLEDLNFVEEKFQ